MTESHLQTATRIDRLLCASTLETLIGAQQNKNVIKSHLPTVHCHLTPGKHTRLPVFSHVSDLIPHALPRMPSISPPLASPPEANPDQVQFLLDLLAARQAIGPYQSNAQAHLSFALDLKEYGIPVRITNDDVNQEFKQTIQIGNRLLFNSFGRKAKECTRWNGDFLLCFFKSLQILIQKAQTGTIL